MWCTKSNIIDLANDSKSHLFIQLIIIGTSYVWGELAAHRDSSGQALGSHLRGMLTFGVYEKMLSSLVNIQMRKDWRAIVLFIPEIEDLVCIVPEKRTGTQQGNLLGKQVLFIHWLIYSVTNTYLVSTVTNCRSCQGHNGMQDGFSSWLHGVTIYWKI